MGEGSITWGIERRSTFPGEEDSTLLYLSEDRDSVLEVYSNLKSECKKIENFMDSGLGFTAWDSFVSMVSIENKSIDEMVNTILDREDD